ncbi:DUF5131 family protein [Nonomuraea basaltis]|uniref:DUF5131 family protein n=1 Tax=Nonomuraea basaltis TaxID=2495887 RepID=UPI00110C6F7D|nr:DUF5131 family protein [Nonomuraea basaltis]TMS00137.1 DUF5131 family protein [Nonomuraea basaltis]
MSDKTGISWSDATWNPIIGCTKVSPGCDHCYPIPLSRIREKNPNPKVAAAFAGVVEQTESGLDWTGRVNLLPERLDQPLRWRKPRRVFVNSLADLFHEAVPDQFIAKVFAVMALAPQHSFQVLSKRHARMRSLLANPEFPHAVARAMDAVQVDLEHDPAELWKPIPGLEGYEASSHGRVRGETGLLATCINPRSGRETVTLWNRGEPKTLTVHRLVLTAHSADDQPGAEVCHRNGDKRDNRLANLRWGTRSENQREKVRHGSRGGPQKLTPAEVEEIRAARRTGLTQQALADRFGISRSLVSLIESGRVWSGPDIPWPLPNVWIGVSCENQQWADIRIPALLETPAAVRWISAEPLLGPIILRDDWLGADPYRRDEPSLNWVVAGGESGPGARPMHPKWVKDLRDQCQQAGVAYHFKQWGEWRPQPRYSTDDRHHLVMLNGMDRGTPWPGWGLDQPEAEVMERVGKKRAGRELDGRTWDEFPQEVAVHG